MDNYSQMLAFIWATEHGNSSAAGRANGLTPSAISKLITRLEDRLQVRLFQRGTRNLTLTEEGSAYLVSAREVINAMAEADSLAQAFPTRVSGALRIHTMTTFAKHQILPWLPEFLSTYPGLTVDIQVGAQYVFFRVVLPLIAPGVISGGLFAFATSFDEVVVTLFLASLEQRTLPLQMFAGIRENISPNIAAVATIMVILSVLMLLTLEVLQRRNEKLIDTALGFGAVLLGHSNDAVNAAVTQARVDGAAPSWAHVREHGAATELARHTGELSKVIFTNSGSEAVHLACRAARAYTGRGKIAKMAAGFDGWFDDVSFGKVTSQEAHFEEGALDYLRSHREALGKSPRNEAGVYSRVCMTFCSSICI